MSIIEKKWTLCTLRDLIEIKHGFAFQGEFFRDDPPGNILLTPGNFAIGGGFKTDKFKYYVGSVPEDYVLEEGNLLVTMTDFSKESDTLGYPAIIPKSHGSNFLHNQRLGKILIKDVTRLHRRFLYYLLCTKEYRNEVISSATGTTVKHTSPNRILAFEFSLPPFEEQCAIACILGSLDNKIELNRQMNETLEAMAKAIFQSWFVDFDPVRAKAEGRQPAGMDAATAALFPSEFEEVDGREVPRGWGVGKLSDVVEINTKSIPQNYPFSQIDYIEISSVSKGVLESSAVIDLKDAPSRAQRLVRHGDTIWSRSSTKSGIISFHPKSERESGCINGFYCPLPPENSTILPLFMGHN